MFREIIFCRALKLAKEDAHTLFDVPGNPKSAFETGTEAVEIEKAGPVSAIYCKTLWDDADVVDALVSDGNMKCEY